MVWEKVNIQLWHYRFPNYNRSSTGKMTSPIRVYRDITQTVTAMETSNLILGKCVEKRNANLGIFSQEKESPRQDT
jgi:hypothetical protein